MHVHTTSYPRLAAALPPEQLRAEFLVAGLFAPGAANFRYWETDRTIIGGITPGTGPIELPNPAEVRSAFFLERREAGVINLGGPGRITVDGTEHAMAPLDGLYLGRGTRAVAFRSLSASQPARFYFLSYPAHAAHPVRHVAHAAVTGTRLGAAATANDRTIFKYFHPGAFPTCQLVMGFTRLEPGCVWNTMPPHTHLRRSEVYLLFQRPAPSRRGLPLHGPSPSETRHLVVRDLRGRCSRRRGPSTPAVGTAANYGFVWGMGGENQDFADMDPAPVTSRR
jgi:4-deoxy-L-threo-5-hexosulose-uronate ketol-isomerase